MGRADLVTEALSDGTGGFSTGLDCMPQVVCDTHGRDPAAYDNSRQFSDGIPHVTVDGEFIVRDGESTGAVPGTAMRN